MPPASNDAIYDEPYSTNYLNGAELVFAYTPLSDGFLEARLSTTVIGTSMWVFTGCPFESTIGWDYSTAQEDQVIDNIPVTAGETYYFVLSSPYQELAYGFTFTLKALGIDCESPIEVQDLPFSHQSEASQYGNDYSAIDLPPTALDPVADGVLVANYINGFDVVYQYTPEEDQFVNASLVGDGTAMALFVFTECPFEETYGWDLLSSPSGLEINYVPVLEGVNYYFVVSSQIQESFTYTFELNLTELPVYDCPELEKNFGDECFDGTYTTAGDYIREDCECEGHLLNANIIVTIPEAATCGNRTFLARCYVPGTNIFITSTSVPIYNPSTFLINGLPEGTVDMYIEIDGALRILLESQTLTEGINFIEITDLAIDDLNGSNSINISDISTFASCFGTTTSSPNYNNLANLNCDSNINLVDFSLLGVNFGLQGVSLP